jgi:putative lipoprotein
MELGKKLVKEHSEVGDQGDITVYYTGNTYTVEQQEYAVFMLVNKTTTNIDHDATFKISWSYDG